MMRGRTTILISHRRDLAMQADARRPRRRESRRRAPDSPARGAFARLFNRRALQGPSAEVRRSPGTRSQASATDSAR